MMILRVAFSILILRNNLSLAGFWRWKYFLVERVRLKPHNITDLFMQLCQKKYINSNLLALGTMSSSYLRRKKDSHPSTFLFVFLQYESKKNEMNEPGEYFAVLTWSKWVTFFVLMLKMWNTCWKKTFLLLCLIKSFIFTFWKNSLKSNAFLIGKKQRFVVCKAMH